MKSFVYVGVALLGVVGLSEAGAQDYWGDAAAAENAGGGYEMGYDSGYADTGGSSRGDGLLGSSEFDYGYLDASYYWFDFDNENFEDGSGFGAALSIPLVDSLFIKGAVNYAASETRRGSDIDYLDWQLGAGLGLPLFRRLDFIIEGGLAYRNLDVDGFEDFGDLFDGWGWYVAPGVRFGLTENLEIDTTFRYIDVEGGDNLGVDIRALIHLTPSISFTGGALFSEDANQYGVGLRLSF